jgi:antitoxin component YwqK of YwqJK toxin-antitoxin module
MMKNKTYSNGQKTYEQTGDLLTYFFKNGKVKAKGQSVHELMEGEWIFYRETGQLWQVGNFKGGQKHGPWVRYGKNDALEYQEIFEHGVQQKKG